MLESSRSSSILLILAFGYIAACGGSTPRADETPSSSTAQAPTAGDTSTGFIGSSFAFDVPPGWHEFYLEVEWPYIAAYGPVAGGDADYVAVGPLTAEILAGRSPKEALRADMGAEPLDITAANGMEAYAVSREQGGLTQQATIVVGPRDSYYVSCQYEDAMADEVAAGCASIVRSLREVPPSPVTHASGCTDGELSLIQEIPQVDGTEPGVIRDLGESCDVQIEFPPGGTQDDVAALLESRLAETGWKTDGPAFARTSLQHDVWRIFAIRDWDRIIVEVYVQEGSTDRYFISVVDS